MSCLKFEIWRWLKIFNNLILTFWNYFSYLSSQRPRKTPAVQLTVPTSVAWGFLALQELRLRASDGTQEYCRTHENCATLAKTKAKTVTCTFRTMSVRVSVAFWVSWMELNGHRASFAPWRLRFVQSLGLMCALPAGLSDENKFVLYEQDNIV